MKKVFIGLCLVTICISAGCKHKATEEERLLSRLLYVDGMKYENLGNMNIALERYSGSLKKNPGNIFARMRLKNLYMKMKQYDRALDLIDDADKDKSWIKNQRGMIYLEKGDTGKARSAFESAIDANAKYPTPYYYLGMIELKKGDRKKAKKFFEQYKKLFAEMKGRDKEEDHVREASHAMIRIDYPQDADRYFEALALYQDGSPNKAETALCDLDTPPALVLKARIFRINDKAKDAMMLLRKAGGYQPAKELFLEMLYAAGGEKNLAEAQNAAKELLKQDPDNQIANLYMGKILIDEGKEKEAGKYIDKAARTGTDDIVSFEAKKLLGISEKSDKSQLAGVENIKKLVKKDSPRRERYRAMMSKIRAASGRDENMSIELELYGDEAGNINALSHRDGDRAFIFISEELADFVEGLPVERDLKNSVMACVIGHELCHILDRHANQTYSMNGVLQSESLIASTEEKDASAIVMNQAHEYEADRTGSMFAYLAGYNPFMLKELYAEIIRARGDIQKNMNHPLFRERIVKLDENLVEMKSVYGFFRKGVADLAPRKNETAEDADNRLARAEKAFTVFKKAFPNNGPALNNLGLVYLQQALAGTVKKRYTYATSVSISPGLVDPSSLEQKSQRKSRGMRDRGMARKARPLDKAKLKLAIGYFERAKKADGKNMAALNNLGIARSYLGRHGEAKSAFAVVLKSEPGNLKALNNLGVCEIAMNNKNEGKKHIREAADKGLAAAKLNL